MPSSTRTLPLAALQAIALDTETTGLDVKTARIVEIGLSGVGQSLAWSQLVNPGVPIPPRSTEIHGISDTMVAEASGFPIVWTRVLEMIGTQMMIGHSLGFDLAILKRECERANIAWKEPIWLDTRFLAIVLDARLPDFSLGTLASSLGLTVTGGHRALADAEATATIFKAMIPRLREKGVHTVGEALAACRKIQSMNDDLAKAGWSEPPPVVSARQGSILSPDIKRRDGFDAYPFQHRVDALMSAPPLFVAPKDSLESALAVMADKRISGLFVGSMNSPASEVAMLTERDVLRALAKAGAEALSKPVRSFASAPLVTIPAGAFAYRAIGRMARLGIRHLAVVSERDGKVIGALSQRDLLRLRAHSAGVLGDDVDSASTIVELGRAWSKIPAMAQALLDEGIGAADIAGIISREVGALTRRAAVFAEQSMLESGHGPAPGRYAVLVLGSAGRGESLLAMDQDNAVVFETGDPDGPEDRWFADFGKYLTDFLHETGVPYCKGGVMASEPAFRGSIATWQARMERWLTRSDPADLLNVDIVFDARTVHGDPTLMGSLIDHMKNAAADNPAFLKLLIASHPDAAAPVSFFGRLKGDDEGRLDLKRYLTSRLVGAARVLAIRHRQTGSSTRERFTSIEKLGIGEQSMLRDLSSAYQRAQDLILRTQVSDISAGRKPDNRVNLSALSSDRKEALKADLLRAADIGEMVRSLAF